MDIRIPRRECFRCRFLELILRGSYLLHLGWPQETQFNKRPCDFYVSNPGSHFEKSCMRPIIGRLYIIGKDISAFYLNALIKWFSFFFPFCLCLNCLTFLKYFVNKYLNIFIFLKKKKVKIQFLCLHSMVVKMKRY